MDSDDLDFALPQDLIAQAPCADRASSRLLHYRRADGAIAHRQFAELPSLLRPGDLLVFNDARVVPARLSLRKPTGGRVDGLFVEELAAGTWRVLLRDAAGLGEGAVLCFADDPGVRLRVERRDAGGEHLVTLSPPLPASRTLERLGRMPLPPYIRRAREHDPRDALDRERYQTVYARHGVAVAAPTAGLHFTDEVLRSLDDAGVERAAVTLDVGIGTFRPVTARRLEDHAMHAEGFEISAAAAEAINGAIAQGRRVIAVGTTSARVLESFDPGRPVEAGRRSTSIFIRPPYAWRRVGALITNFHLPRSTLIALVAAHVGLEQQRRVYAEAIARRYRFFSYGDSSLLE